MFVGLVVNVKQSYEGDAGATALEPYRQMVFYDCVALLIGFSCAATAVAWLVLLREHQLLYVVTVLLFIAQMIGTGAASGLTIRRLVWEL